MRCAVLALVLCAAGAALAQDPAPSWLSYGAYTSPNQQRVTYVNTTWIVPSAPETKFGSNAPGWWFGVQTADGAGALIQPILAYGYQGDVYSIFNGVFDWNDESWHTSPEVYTVQPGDKITSYVKYLPASNGYEMYIYSANLNKGITTTYNILPQQGNKNESVVYFVLEHQPRSCRAYPKNGVCTFDNINIEVDNQPVASPRWESKQENPACHSEATVVDPHTLRFTWSDGKAEAPRNATAAPTKWLPKRF